MLTSIIALLFRVSVVLRTKTYIFFYIIPKCKSLKIIVACTQIWVVTVFPKTNFVVSWNLLISQEIRQLESRSWLHNMPKYNKVETTHTARKSNLFKNKYKAEKQNIMFYFLFIYLLWSKYQLGTKIRIVWVKTLVELSEIVMCSFIYKEAY